MSQHVYVTEAAATSTTATMMAITIDVIGMTAIIMIDRHCHDHRHHPNLNRKALHGIYHKHAHHHAGKRAFAASCLTTGVASASFLPKIVASQAQRLCCGWRLCWWSQISKARTSVIAATTTTATMMATHAYARAIMTRLMMLCQQQQQQQQRWLQSLSCLNPNLRCDVSTLIQGLT